MWARLEVGGNTAANPATFNSMEGPEKDMWIAARKDKLHSVRVRGVFDEATNRCTKETSSIQCLPPAPPALPLIGGRPH